MTRHTRLSGVDSDCESATAGAGEPFEERLSLGVVQRPEPCALPLSVKHQPRWYMRIVPPARLELATPALGEPCSIP